MSLSLNPKPSLKNQETKPIGLGLEFNFKYFKIDIIGLASVLSQNQPMLTLQKN